MNAEEIANAHIIQAARGLDMQDADDRAIFRTRLAEGMTMVRFHFIQKMAQQIGAERRSTRTGQINAIANHHIEMAGRR